MLSLLLFFFFQAEDGIRDAQESRGLGDVYKRQLLITPCATWFARLSRLLACRVNKSFFLTAISPLICLLYTSDAADDLLCVDLGGRRIIKKKKHE